jgi:hypothetical protein
MGARRWKRRRAASLVAFLVAATVALVGCGSNEDAAPDGAPSAAEQATADTTLADSTGQAAQRFPDILSAELVPGSDGSFDVAVTVSSPYDTPERYADGWRVLAPDGSVLGAHTLLHDHAGEQPFTRTQRGLVVPADVEEVTIEGRDLVHGYGGGTVVVGVPAR